MASSDNEDVCIAGSSIKLVAKFSLSILSLAIKNVRAATKTTNLN